jgi:two-component system cell cycle sensor histidine kinase/response regulator CckA
MNTPRVASPRTRKRPENLEDFYTSAVPRWIFDEKSLAILEINDAAVRKFGYSRKEFLKLTMLEISPLEDIPKLLRSALHSPASRRYGGVWRHQKKDGSVLRLRIVSRKISFAGHDAELVSAEEVNPAANWS